ncbi:MAG: hypothetical protein OCD01_05630 [Fibrobacterales bacterium]
MKKKIDNEYGYFGFAEDKDKIIFAGQFKSINGRFVISLTSCVSDKSPSFSPSSTYDVIYGILSDGRHVSLHDCYNKSFRIGSHAGGADYFFEKGYIGESFFNVTQKINKVTFSTNHLFLWLHGCIAFDSDINMKDKTCTLKYITPPDKDYNLSGSKKAVCKFEAIFPGSTFAKSKYTITSLPRIEIKSSNHVFVDTLFEYIWQIQRLISFCMLDKIHVNEIRVYANGRVYNVLSENTSEQESREILHPMRAIFSLKEADAYFDNIFEKWTAFEDKYGEVSRLFLQCINFDELTLDNLAINLTTALESYNRIRTNSKMHLNDRLKEEVLRFKKCIKKKSAIIRPTSWAQRIADTRNYYAHILSNKEKKRLKGAPLFYANYEQRHLLIAIILSELGLTENQIKTIFETKAFN